MTGWAPPAVCPHWHPQGELRLGLPRHKSRSLSQGPGETSFPWQLSLFASSSPKTELCCHIQSTAEGNTPKGLLILGTKSSVLPTRFWQSLLFTFTVSSPQPVSLLSCYMFVVSAGCRTAAGDAVFFTSAHQAYHKWFPSLINCMSKQNLFNNAFPFSGSSLQSREMSWQNMQ